MTNFKETFLIFIGYCRNEINLTNRELFYSLLKYLPQLIEMKAIGDPIISAAQNNPGLECYVPIDTSNITISTYTNELKIVGCIHSCKDFNYNKVIKYIKSSFDFVDIKFLTFYESDFEGNLS